MTERLDRIESLLADTAQQLNRTAARQDRTAAQQAKNTEDIDTLLGVVAFAEARIDRLMARAEVSDQRFEVLRAEAITDRQEFRQRFNDAVDQMHIDRAQAEADRRKADERHSAQMEVIQTLLLELTKTNGNVTKLRDRMDGLERAD